MIHIPPGAPFPVRGFNLCESILRHTPEQLRTFIRRMKTLNMNTLIIHYDYGWKRYQQLILEECRKAGIQITLMTFGPRTFFSYSDWKKDFFAKDPQGQPYTNQLECETQPCRFVPEALAAFEFGAGQWLKSLPPEITRVHMRAGDGMMFCQCEKCRLLPEYERWQPFVECFVKAVQEKRPELEYETDIYYKRYRIPAEQAAFSSMKYIMYDTFFRKPSCPWYSTPTLPAAPPGKQMPALSMQPGFWNGLKPSPENCIFTKMPCFRDIWAAFNTEHLLICRICCCSAS